MVVFHAYTPFLLIFWLLAVPLFSGIALSVILPDKGRRIGNIYLLGLFASFVIFEPIAVYCMLRPVITNFSTCIAICCVILMILTAAGIVRTFFILARRGGASFGEALSCVFPGHRVIGATDIFYPRRDRTRISRQFTKSELLYTVIFFLLLAIQLIMAVFYAPFDGDDAYYVVLSLQAQQTDTMNTLIPYIGYSTVLDFRHALADYVLWIAFIARLCGIHATILAHTVLPLVWIPLSYYIYARIGQVMLKDRQELVPLFLCFVSVFSVFGNVSIYTPETFFLMRTWQGKSMICNVVIPLILLALLALARRETDENKRPVDRRERLQPWLFLYLANASAGFFSTSGILMVFLLLASGMCIIAVAAKSRTIWQRIRFLLFGVLSCVPGMILAGMAYMLK